MLFFKITAYYECEYEMEDSTEETPRRPRTRRYESHKIAQAYEPLNKSLDGRAFFCLSEKDDGRLTGAVITENRKLLDANLGQFFDALKIYSDSDDISVEEITLKDLSRLLQIASRNDYIESDDEVMAMFGLDNVYDDFRRNVDFAENLIPKADKAEIMKLVKKTMDSGALLPEIGRIYAPSAKVSNFGIPVHYMFLTIDDGDSRKNTYRTLLSALFDARRLQSQRYAYMDCDPTARFSRKGLEHLYNTCSGATVILRYQPIDEVEEDNHASANRALIEILCDTIKKYQNDVLSILCIPVDCVKVRQMFYDYLGSLNVVEIKEERVSREDAKKYLRLLSKEKELQADKNLYARVEEGKQYRADELQEMFQQWWHEKMKRTIYPAYRNMQRAEAVAVQTKAHGSAYDELMEMIGLTEAKKVINEAIDYFRAQRIFKEKGFQTDRPAMSMVFTGNPGSAKTTVARLVAEILKDEGILETGRFIECGRGDLVGRFVGWTAPTIQKKFREAKGGVLFIDEAYSLVDDRDGSFGDEAINTVVQEMENHRSDVVVIFAGYPDKMEGFLQKNPGLRSRIAFHVPFADYDTNELVDIAELMAKKKNLVLAPETVEKMRSIFDEIGKQPDFGNGRAVRNVLEAAKMAMSSRLLRRSDIDKLTEADVKTVLPEDISAPVLTANATATHRVVGF